jgi:hypothetical protein
MSKSRQVHDLLAAIQRKNVAPPEASPVPAEQPPTPAKRGRVGRPVQFWMHEEDLRILRELSAWLAAQGIRTSDSLVIRATLRSARTGSELLQCYREAANLDGRLKSSSKTQSV